MPRTIDGDYLVVGAGAMAMAFVDTLLAATEARVVMVDRCHQPGGHWNLAYPFVRLHQPSIGYGVDSRRLGSDAIDRVGWNEGLFELASVGEVCAYFDQVMREVFLPSGRVDYFPMCDYLGGGRFRSRISGDEYLMKPNCRIVDSTYQNVVVPAMRAPPYDVANGVQCMAPNGLVSLAPQAIDRRFTIVGAGKTGMDTCLWLLRQGVEPDRITWIMPRDSWLIDRSLTQPGPQFADRITPVLVGTIEAAQTARSVDDLFDRLEACGRLIRLDSAIRPRMYRCATVSIPELEQLRRVRDVVRLGRVRRIERDRIILDDGEIATSEATLHVDCSADGLQMRPSVPVFADGTITLQSVRTCQQVFSAALIARVEAMPIDDAARNRLCMPIPHPDTAEDFLRTTIADADNEAIWSESPGLQAWLAASRLNWVRDVGPRLPDEPVARAEAMALRRALMSTVRNALAVLYSPGVSAEVAATAA